MRRSLTFVVPLLLVVAGYVGCGGTSAPGGGTCPGGAYSCGQVCEGANPPPECTQACDGSTPCPSGFYCGTEGECTSDCTSSGDANCPNGVCTSEGHCEEPPDAGSGGGSGGGAGGGGGDVCLRESVTASPVTPNVVFVIDRSGSMEAELDTDTIDCPCPSSTRPNNCYADECDHNQHLSRWDQLRSMLIGSGGSDEGLIGSLDDRVRFGVALYTENGSGGCPDMTYAPTSSGDLVVALDNYESIASVYSVQSPGVWTPTANAIGQVMQELDDTGVLDREEPTYLILATDGRPGSCGSLDDSQDPPNETTGSMNDAVDAVEAARTAGVDTFVIAVGDPDDLPASHFNALAAAGRGAGAEAYYVENSAELSTALEAVMQGALSCEVELQGTVTNPEQGCATGGEVTFVGPGNTRTPIPCDSTNGWTLVDANTIELRGTSCQTLQNTPGLTLDVSFPCGVIIVVPL